ncbi:MAG TPA: phosphate ABC transporter permease, partial [Candidatus Eisenbacteria bacterium]|nr:phosphate ABC transporter permease [Candidatus Eisenbacteria bacterium]
MRFENGTDPAAIKDELLMSEGALRFKKTGALVGRSVLVAVASSSVIALLFIFYYIIRDAVPFFQLEGIREFLTSTRWYPSREDAEFGALAIFIGSGLVTLGAIAVAVPMGVLAALCLSDILPFNLRQIAKPIIEMLAAIPSVVYGFFALVVFAPLMQRQGGGLLAVGMWLVLAPIAVLAAAVSSDALSSRFEGKRKMLARAATGVAIGAIFAVLLLRLNGFLSGLSIVSGTNALNASIILGIMALPTIVSVSEDALGAVGRDLREGSY